MKFSLKLFGAIMTIALVLCLATSVFAAVDVSQFTDFPTGSWSETALKAGVDNGLINGKGDGRIAPKDYITRAETAAIINRAFGATVKADISKYTDVSSSKWYYADMQKAVNMQTIQGVSDTELRPDGYITREQVFTILARALVISDTNETKLMSFSDGGSVSSWARAYTAALVNRGYVNGNAENRLKPQDYITREEFAQVMHNIFKQYIVGEGSKLSNATFGTTVVRTPGLTLNNLVINGDLIIADGVGNGDITLKNVKVSGRILFRGGEGKVKIEDNTTTGEFVIVHDVNGVVNFHNYRTHSLFKNIVLDTEATFLKPVGGGSGGGTAEKKDYTINIYKQKVTDAPEALTKTYDMTSSNVSDKAGKEITYTPEDIEGFSVDAGKSVLTGENNGSLVIEVYYNRDKYDIEFNGSTYPFLYGQKLFDGTTLGDALSAFISSQKAAGYDVAYTFDGSAVTPDSDKTATKGGTVEFTKTPIQYTVTYNLGAADAYFDTTPDGNITVEETLTLPTPKRDGYVFVAWYLDSALTQPVTEISVGTTSDITVYAEWRLASIPATKYTITYNGIGYEVEEGKPLSSNASLKAAMDATTEKTGYTLSFEGTYTKNGSPVTTPVTTSTPAVADMEIKAVYTAIEYTITYYSNGVVYGTATYTIEDAVTLPILTDSANDFNGWYADSAFTNGPVTAIAVGTTGNKTFYAKWTPKDVYFIMTYEGNEYPIKAGERLDSNQDLINALNTAVQKPGYLLRWKGYYMENGQEKWTGLNISTVPDRDMTIKPDYTLSYYGIWLYSNGTQYQEIRYCIYDEVILPVPTDVAYFFNGWYDNEQFTGTPVTKIEAGTTGSIHLYAKWTPKAKYTITYNGVEYNAYEDQKIKDAVDANANKLSDALATYVVPEGYERDGYKIKGTDVSVDLEANASQTIELEPKNKVIVYTITYYSNGVVYGTATYTVEDAVTLPVLADSANDFNGWYADSAFTNGPVTAIAVGTIGNKTFYAKWTPKTTPATMYTITFGGVDYEVEEGKPLYTNVSLKTAMEAAEKDGYTVSFKNADTSATVTVDTVASADMEIEAVYTLIKYTITYMYGGTEVLTKGEYTVEDSVTLPTYSKVGYNFNGWYEDEALTSGPVTAIAVGTTGNKVYYAKLTLKPDPEIGFSYEKDEANNKVTVYVELSAMPKNIDDLAAMSIYYTQSPKNMTLVSAEPLFVAGSFAYSDGALVWINQNDSITESELIANDGKLFKLVYSYTHPTNGDVVLSYADSTELASSTYKIGTGYTKADATIPFADSYTVTFNGTDYEVEEGKALSSNASLKAAMGATEEKTGYTLSFKNVATSDVVTVDTVVSADMEIEIVYTAIEYTITYYSNGVVYGTATYTIEDAVTLPVLTDSANDFNGWYADSAFTNGPVTAIAVGTTGNKEFYAKWTPKAPVITYYTITFNGVDYEVEEGKALSSNASLKAAMGATEEKTGYTLSFKNVATSDVVTVDTVASADMTIEAVYTAIEYTITYYSNGVIYATATYTIEESVTLPVLTDASNSFDGWYTDSAFTNGPVTAIAVGTTGNKEFYAKWTPVTEYFTVTFDGMTYQVEAGQALSTNNELKTAMEAVVEKTGYTLSFEGTYTLGGLETTEEVALDSLVNADMTIEAKYTAIKYTITYMHGSTEVLTKVEYTIEDTVTLSDYSVEGYTFHGWFEDEAFTSGPVTEIPVGTTGDKVYYAYLVEIPDVPDIFTVSFYEGTKKFKGSYDVEEGTTLTQAHVDAYLGDPANYSMQEGYTDSDGNVHKIAPELWYMVDGEWKTYDPETVVIDRDTDVHLFTRFAAFYYDTNLKFKGVKIPRIELTIAYDSNTPITHSYLDTLTAMSGVLEGTIDNIETATGIDLFQTALNAAAKFKIVDENGNIVNPEVPVPLHKIITEELIMEQIDNYINQNINNEEFIAEILRNDTVVEMILGDEAIREKVLSDADMRDKLLTTATIKKIIANDDVIEWIITNEEFKKKFIDSDATFDYIIGDLKELLDNSEYHDTIIDACVEFVIDVYFEKTISAPELVNYIDSVLDSPEFIADIEAKPELRSLFKDELKGLLIDLDKNTTSQETRDEVYAEIRGNNTMKNAIIEAVLDNDDIMDDIMAELRDDLAGTNSDYRDDVIDAVRAEFADSTSTLKAQIITAVKDDLKLGAGSALRDTVIDAITEDFNSATPQLKDTVMDYATGQITTSGSSLRDSILAEAATPGSDIEGYVKDYASTDSGIKAEIKPLVKDNTEVKAQAQQWISTNIASVKDDIKSAMFTNEEALVIAIKEAVPSISDADAQEYAEDYIAGTIDTSIKNEIDTNIDNFFADDAQVLSMVEANFDTFYSASYDTLFDELYADPDVFGKAYESYVADASKLEDAFDKYVSVPANLESAVNKFIENADNLADAIEMFVDNASDNAIGDAVDTYIENDDNLIAAVNTYIADDDNLAVVFDLFKEDEDNLKKAFETYIADDDNLGDAIHTFASNTDVFEDFYEEHLSENAANPDTFNALFESYYHTHVHDVADKAWDNVELHDLIMTYVHDYTEDMVESYADGSLETEHPELVDTIDSLMHESFPDIMREKYYEPGSTIKATIDHLIEEEGTTLIKKYVNDEIDDADTVVFIEDTIEENVGIIVDDYVDGKLDADIKALIDSEIDSYMEKLINDYINNVGDARETLGELVPTYAKDAVDTLKATDAFKNTISDFTSGNGVRVNEGNIMFISILSELMGEYDYETLMADFAPASVKTITDKVGKELASKYVNALLDTFVSGIKEAEASLQADIDNGIEGTEYRFTTTPRLRVYFMEDFVAAPYNKVSPKIAEKLNAIDLIAINPYAQRLVNMNLIEEYLDYDASAATEELSGYSVKKGYYDEIDEVYGSPIVRYYDIELSHKILLHDAIMWYGKDYLGHATVEAKLDAISALLGTYANEANEAIVEYLQTGELPEDFIGKFLGKNGAIDSAYDKAEDIYYQNEDKILQLADKIDDFYLSKLNKDYTEVIDLAGISVYADGKAYPVYGILLELYGEGDAFTIDALATAIFDSDNYLGVNAIENGMNKIKNAFVDKFAYNPGTYTNKIVRDAYKAELEARSIKGISTGSHSVELQRYFQYIK